MELDAFLFIPDEEEQREAAANSLSVFDSRLHNRSSITSLQAPLLPGNASRDQGSRSGSIVSSSPNWRKGSVTIPEKAEDGEEEEDEETANVSVKISASEQTSCDQEQQPMRLQRLSSSGPSPCKSGLKNRRLSSCGESSSSMDENFLTVPQTVTASSSAETLTGLLFIFRQASAQKLCILQTTH